MLVDPPLPTGYDLLGEAGDEIEGVQLTRSPDRDRVLLATPHKAPVAAATAPAAAGAVAARPATLRFAALPGGRFLMEQSEPDKPRPFHAYHLIEPDRTAQRITVIHPLPKESAELRALFRRFGFDAEGDELTPGARHDMVGLFRAVLGLVDAAPKLLDRSIVYRRVGEAEWQAALARLHAKAQRQAAEEARSAQAARDAEQKAMLALRATLQALPGCARYKVRPGDSAAAIAAAAGLPLAQLQDLNRQLNLQRLAVDDALNVRPSCPGG